MRAVKQAEGVARYLYLGFGWFFLGLGLVGIFIPLLPTTPFLILAAWCLKRGSHRFHAWMMHNRWLGPPVKEWHEKKVIRVKHKIAASLAFLGSGIYLLVKPGIHLELKIGFGVVAVSCLTFIWTRKSK